MAAAFLSLVCYDNPLRAVDPSLVEFMFSSYSCKQTQPRGVQNPKNGDDTHIPWGLIILWVASLRGSVVYTPKSDPSVPASHRLSTELLD